MNRDDVGPPAGDPLVQAAGRKIGVAEVAQVFGLLAGTTTLVYVSGGAILSLRLNAKGLASEAVVSDLPHQLLVSIGLTEVVLPLLVAGSILTAALFVIVRLSDIEFAAQALGGWARATKTQRRGLVAAIVATTAGGLLAAGLVFDWGVLSLLLVLATASLFWGAGAAIRAHFADRLASLPAVVWTGILFAACFTPWLVAGAERRHELLKSTVCLSGSPPITGYLIGETADQVYVGEQGLQGGGGRGLIVVLPRARVQGLYIGGNSDCAQLKGG